MTHCPAATAMTSWKVAPGRTIWSAVPESIAVSYAESLGGVNVSIGTNAFGATGDDAGDAIADDIENPTGSQFNDVLGGVSASNVLLGLGGNDFLGGEGGDDVLNGGDGDDILVGGFGKDRLIGGAGIDRIDYQEQLRRQRET